MRRTLSTLSAAFAAACTALAGTQAGAAVPAPPPLLHELFTDHAVLQRDQPIAVPMATPKLPATAKPTNTRHVLAKAWRSQVPD